MEIIRKKLVKEIDKRFEYVSERKVNPSGTPYIVNKLVPKKNRVTTGGGGGW